MNPPEHREQRSALDHTGWPLRSPEIFLTAALGVVFTAVWAVALGKGVSWDQKNYHYYDAYAWLAGRMDFHVAPAGLHSWLNPLAYVPHSWVINHAPPVVAGAIFGAVAGLNFVLIYSLARLVLRGCAPRLAMGIAFACAVVGFSDPLFLGLIGATDVDNVVSLPVLGSLCAVCWASRSEATPPEQNRAYAVAGILLGLAAGLKWTCFVYALGMSLTLLILWSVLQLDLQRFLRFAGGGVAGFLATGGYWSWLLWSAYGNPFFPYWNRYFRSPWAEPGTFRDIRFMPKSAADAITYPFQWFIGLHPSSEEPFRDGRFAVLAVLIPLMLVALFAQRMARRWVPSEEGGETARLAAGRDFWFLLTFSVTSYLAWMKMFSIQRYLLPLGFLAGLLLLLTLDWLLRDRVSKLATFCFLALFCVLWARMESQAWRVPYGSSWFGVELPAEATAPDTLFIMLGDGPMGYVVPYLPESTRVIRLISSTIPDLETKLVERARDLISQHSGPIRSLSMVPLAEADFSYLNRFGLALDEGDCTQFRSAVDQFTTCRVMRLQESGSPVPP
jgi:hypothetical protein